MKTVDKILAIIRKSSSPESKKSQEYFGIKNIDNYGVTVPQMRSIAKSLGKNHSLALDLWKTGVHEARHIAVMIADPKLVTEKLMERWLKDFNSWDIVDNSCGTIFIKSPIAYSKAIEWSGRRKEFEKRAGFSMMAMLAVHDKTAPDENFESFFPYLLRESSDERNFVRKANNWAIRQIGKRNLRLCKKAIKWAEEIRKKDDKASRWIAADALRELNKYLKEGKIKDVGKK
jgi:3-methyladenine DNA glycosylase AlkD